MEVLEGRHYDELVSRLARSPSRYTARIAERLRSEVAPAHLEPVQADLRELVDQVMRAVFAVLLSGESLEEEAVLAVRRAAERWSSRRVPFSTVLAISSAAARAAVEVTQELARERDKAVAVEVVGRGIVIAQELVAAAAAGYGRSARRSTAADPAGPGGGAAPVGLTRTSADVLGLVAEGRTNVQVAAELGLSRQTVNYHVGRLMRALGAVNRTAVVARAYDLGLLPR